MKIVLVKRYKKEVSTEVEQAMKSMFDGSNIFLSVLQADNGDGFRGDRTDFVRVKTSTLYSNILEMILKNDKNALLLLILPKR